MNTVDGDEPLGDASPLSSPDGKVQGQHVHGTGPSVVVRLSFASAVTGLDRRIALVSLKDLLYLTNPANEMMLPILTPVDYTASLTTEAGGPHNRNGVLVRIDSRPWIDKRDDNLRPMIPLKEEALAARMMSGIALPSPPGFLVCTQPRATRVAMLDFLEDYLEGKVLAVVPPSVRMTQHIAEKTLLLQLLERREGETASDPLSRQLVKGAKCTCYDTDTRRLAFILADQEAAASWHTKYILFRGTCFQLLCPATMERDDIADSSTPSTTPTRHILQYQVRILVHVVAASTVQTILSVSHMCHAR